MAAGKVRLCLLLAAAAPLLAQTVDPPDSPDTSNPPERWNLYYQATSIGQYHPGFHSPYEGPFSLVSHPEAEASLTSTIYSGLRLAQNTQFYFDPELAGGRGISGVNGIVDFPNGEMPRITTATPKPYIARLYVTQDFGFGDSREAIESDQNQLGGSRPATRYSITVGLFSVTDFFDDNAFSHDPRTQFMGWAVMYNGAWDYPADTHGYTWGWVHEFHARRWSARYASAAMPRVANGEQFDRRVLVDRGDVFEEEVRGKPRGQEGSIRFLEYVNHARMGNYGEALQLAAATGTTPDVTATRRPGTRKYGFGINASQSLTSWVGVFARLGWNDGKTESFAFTAIDRLVSGGVSFNGARWGRPGDTVATAFTVSGLSAVHALYLERSGFDFLIGDGTLRYGTEDVSESYYSARLARWLFASLDLQHVTNPAYNRDRGPVWVAALRFHIQCGK